MAAFSKAYAKQMAKKFGYFATWLPTSPLRLGDYGILSKNYIFVRRANVSDLGIAFDTRGDQTAGSIDYQTSGAVSISVDVTADPNLPSAPIKTKIGFTFSRKRSVVFKANGVRVTSIENQVALGHELRKLLPHSWNKKYRVITELVEADTTTIIIANSRSSKLELSATGDISANIDIANASLKLAVTTQHEMSYTDIAKSGISPLFLTTGLKSKDGFFRAAAALGGPSPGLDALDLVTDDDIAAHPEEYFFGKDSLVDLLADEDVDEDEG
ncbi:MAG: hypothetical protein V3T84_14110 [Phycisphaerales bacterium]